VENRITTFVPATLKSVIKGASVDATLTEKLQESLLPLVSLARQVTEVEPTEKSDPLGGVQTTDTSPSQLSVAIGVVQVTTPDVLPGVM
jgi:hypothetical protein